MDGMVDISAILPEEHMIERLWDRFCRWVDKRADDTVILLECPLCGEYYMSTMGKSRSYEEWPPKSKCCNAPCRQHTGLE